MIFGGLLALVTSAAGAADILPPAPSLDSSDLRGRFELETGAYMRADASLGWARAHNAASTFANPVSDFRLDSARFSHAPVTGLGFGYQLNGFLRADLTVEQRGSARYTAAASYQDAPICGATRCADTYAGGIRSTLVMANAYGEVGSWFDVTPFVGLGLGLARNAFEPVSLPAGNGHSLGQSAGATQTRFAYALMAGLAYEVTPQVKVEASYRYLNMGAAQSGVITCASAAGACVGQTQRIGLAAHDLRIGLRYALSSGSVRD
jgi:hypothetical protein